MCYSSHAISLGDLDYIPIISTAISGPVRIVSGLVKMVVNIICLATSILFGWIDGPNEWGSYVLVDVKNIIKNSKDIFRGIIALVPLLGNGALILYDEYRRSNKYKIVR